MQQNGNPKATNSNFKKRKLKRRIGVEPILSSLPIDNLQTELINAIFSHKTTIVIGETGSGKSTRLPVFIHRYLRDRGGGTVVCTQPRRVAAVTIAQRVAAETGSDVGDVVGYTVRFDDQSSAATRIKYVTDGVLLREAIGDNTLSRYSVVVLDEAHERSISTDILIGILRTLQDQRTNFRVVVMSATLDSQLYSTFFLDSNTVFIPGRQFPVQV